MNVRDTLHGDAADQLIVRVELHLPISRGSWELSYGVGGSNSIRADVRAYVDSLVKEHLRGLALLNETD